MATWAVVSRPTGYVACAAAKSFSCGRPLPSLESTPMTATRPVLWAATEPIAREFRPAVRAPRGKEVHDHRRAPVGSQRHRGAATEAGEGEPRGGGAGPQDRRRGRVEPANPKRRCPGGPRPGHDEGQETNQAEARHQGDPLKCPVRLPEAPPLGLQRWFGVCRHAPETTSRTLSVQAAPFRAGSRPFAGPWCRPIPTGNYDDTQRTRRSDSYGGQ